MAAVWLPRTCGDTPAPDNFARDWYGAPPHLRGYTPSQRPRRADHAGSPAPAGIHPENPFRVAVGFRLPRTCGDTPWRRGGIGRLPRAPPHLRGYTRQALRWCRDRPGSPAPAGIHPSRIRSARSSSGLPRTCGDTPVRMGALTAQNGAPPHLRGYTLGNSRLFVCGAGSPAPAGIHPLVFRLYCKNRWLPRTCGDTPLLIRPPEPRRKAPPHLRGYTHMHQRQKPPLWGSPAPAGIHPKHQHHSQSQQGLPRTCGDTPLVRALRVEGMEAPPHLRGYTP